MNARFVPPLIALTAGLAWAGYQHRRLETAERTRTILRQEIAAAQALAQGRENEPAISSRGPKVWQAAFGDHEIHWDKLVELREFDRKSISSLRLTSGLEKRFATMTADEIEVEYNRTQAMKLPDSERRDFQTRIIEELIKRDPGWVVRQVSSQDSPIASMEPMEADVTERAFKGWLKKDWAGALQWMDGQVVAGRFTSRAVDDGASRWITLERQIFWHQYPDDPAAAFAGIGKMPEELRIRILSGLSSNMLAGDWKAYFGSIRATFPAKEFAEILDESARGAAREGAPRVEALAAAAQATPEERKRLAGIFLRQQASELSGPALMRIDEARAWAKQQQLAPADIARFTGEGLGDIEGSSEGIAELARHYAQEGDGDAILDAFLRHSDATPEKAGSLLGRISNESLRGELEEILKSRTESERRLGGRSLR